MSKAQLCVQDTVVYVPRARLYMCPGHNHRKRLAIVTETRFNQTIVHDRSYGDYNCVSHEVGDASHSHLH